MNKIRAFFRISPPLRNLLIRLVFYVVRAEAVCTFLPYSIVKRYVFPKKIPNRQNAENPYKILYTNYKYLKIVCRKLPWNPTCLRQAIALRDSLAYAGVESDLKIGVLQKDKELRAHAWLECCGKLVLKNDEYNELVTIGGDADVS